MGVADAYSVGSALGADSQQRQPVNGRFKSSLTAPTLPEQGSGVIPDVVANSVVEAIDAPVKLRRRRGRFIETVTLAIADAVSAAVGALVGGWLAHALTQHVATPRLIAFTTLASLLGLVLHGGYRSEQQRLSSTGVRRSRAAFSGYPTAAIVLALLAGSKLGVGGAALAALPAVITLPAGRRIARLLPMPGRAQTARVLIVGSGKVAWRVAGRLSRVDGFHVVGMVDNDPPPGEQVLGTLTDLVSLVDEHRIDRVLVAFSRTPGHDTLEMLRKLNHQVSVSVVPRMFEMLSWRSSLEEIDGIPLLHVAPASLSPSARFMKRVIDLIVASSVLIVLFPVMAIAAIAIRFDSPGPVFFRQQRWGRRGEPFEIVKFRTMQDGADPARKELPSDSSGPLFKLRADPRVTRIGAFLRRTSLDELPQLLNVLRGQMSLVGPRPFVPDEAAQIGGYAARRFDVLPGMTGLWQISGRSDLDYDDLRHLDTIYVSSWSIWWDLRILLETPQAVFRRKGAF